MFKSFSKYTSLKVNAGNSLETPAQKKRRKICVAAVICFFAAVVLTLMAFAMRFLWRKLYIENERLVFKHIRFTDTRHYSATPTDGHADLLHILEQGGIQAGKTNLLDIDLDTVQAILKQQSLLTNIKITKVLPDTLQIEAREHKPEATLVIRNPRQLPIAVCSSDQNSQTPFSIIVLPQKIDLYSERDNSYKPWNYTRYPQPFDTTKEDLPQLLNFNFVNTSITPGTVLNDKRLSAAIKIIRSVGITSTNRHFKLDRLEFIAPNTLRLRVIPQKQGSKIKEWAAIDMDCDRISDDLFTKLSLSIDQAESRPETTSIGYINATGKSFNISPEFPK